MCTLLNEGSEYKKYNRSQGTCNELFHFTFSQPLSWLHNNVRSGKFPGLAIGNSNHCGVRNTRVRQNQRL